MTQNKPNTGGDKVQFCDEKWRLSEAFAAASHEVMELQTQQTQAVIAEDPDFTRFDDLLQMARAKKNQTKYELIAHIEEHNC